MDIKSPMINFTKELINEYALSVSITKDMQIALNRTLNQLYILDLVYDAESDPVKKIIDREVLNVQKKIKESTKASSGFFGRFVGGWQSEKSGISIEQIWGKLAQVPEVTHYRHLIAHFNSLHASKK